MICKLGPMKPSQLWTCVVAVGWLSVAVLPRVCQAAEVQGQHAEDLRHLAKINYPFMSLAGWYNSIRLAFALAAQVSPPPSDRLHRKLGSVMIDSHADPAGVGRFIVDAVGDDLAQHLIREVMAVDLLGLPVRVPLLAAIAVRAYEFFLLGINRYDRLPPL